jgi:NTE family protein
VSPGPDTIIQSALERRNLPALIAALPLLKELDAQTLEEVTREIEWFSLPGGSPLYTAGQPTDGLYVVVNGALGLYAGQPGSGAGLCGSIAPGETVGEMDVLSGKPRSVTAVTLRDTEVARISVDTFEKLAAANSQIVRQVALIVARRLEALQHGEHAVRPAPRSFAVVPAGPDVDALEFGEQLAESLRAGGRTELVVASQAKDQTSHWFHRLERANNFVVYISDSGTTSWSKLCARQADCSVLLANTDSDPVAWQQTQPLSADPATAPQPVELVLLHRGPRRGRRIRDWLDVGDFRRYHHVASAADVARVARLLTARGVGLVLSGGGARGFAHIGVLRALSEAHFPIDAVGATSIGAIIGAGWAAGWGVGEMIQRMRRSFVEVNPLGDYTLPLISLAAGRRVNRLLSQEFGGLHIEDLQLPFFCVSANLTEGQVSVHRRGRLWFWLRASIAIPGVLPPVVTQGQVYVDGATLNNLPVDLMRETIDGTILAVDVGADSTLHTKMELTEMPPLWRLPQWLRRNPRRINVIQILLRAGMMNSATAAITQRQLADVVIKPPLERIDLLDWRAFDRVIELGYRHASENLEHYWAARNARDIHKLLRFP